MKIWIAPVLLAAALVVGLPHVTRAECQSDEILVQAKPGFNPDGVKYRVYGPISLAAGEQNVFSITDTRGADACMDFPDIPVGGTLTVDASFSPKRSRDGGASVSCEQSFTVVSPGSIACGPIEVYYQVHDGTCVIICN